VTLRRRQIARTQAIIAKKTIRAPFARAVGIADVHPGQYLNEGTQLSTLQGIDGAVHVDFAVSQQVAMGLRAGTPVQVETTADSTPITARIVAVDARVDPVTRTTTVRATIVGGAPAPGSSVRGVRSGRADGHGDRRPRKPRCAAVPPAITCSSSPPTRAVRPRARAPVRSGPMLGDEIVILDGLTAGEQVAASGSFKLREGVLVAVDAPKTGGRSHEVVHRSIHPAPGARGGRESRDRPRRWRALASLPVQQYPNIQSSSVVINTVYYGASAEAVRGFSRRRSSAPCRRSGGIDYLESTSRAGISTVTIHLKLNQNSTAALAEVTARLQQCDPSFRRKPSPASGGAARGPALRVLLPEFLVQAA